METVQAQIVTFKNTNYFIYNNDRIVIYPTTLDAITSQATAITPTDVVVERVTIEELMEEFDSLGFIMPEVDENGMPVIEPKWHDEDRLIRVIFTHDNATKMILGNPMLPVYMVQNSIIVIHEADGVYIYLNDLFEEHRMLFEMYGGNIVDKAEIIT